MSDWTKSYSSLELLETLRKDLEMLDDVHGIDPENTTASISVVDALIERLEHLETEVHQ
jgi:hypothetical protein